MSRSFVVRRPLVLFFSIVAMVTMAQTPAVAKPDSGAKPTVFPGASSSADSSAASGTTGSGVPQTSGFSIAATCQFETWGDNVHISGSDVSGHGWWVNISCPNYRAYVRIWVEEYYSDGSWRSKGFGSKTVWPGGGSANRANARATCQGSTVVSWRSRVDVDVLGIEDDAIQHITPVQNLPCIVW